MYCIRCEKQAKYDPFCEECEKRLKNIGCSCNCDEPEWEDYVHNGEFKEIMTICINCGGYQE